MAKARHLLRGLIALAMALPLAVVAGSPAAAAPTQSFLAHHTYACFFSYTHGTIDWNADTTTVIPRVDLVGVLVDDRYLCDQRPVGEPFALFTAYVRGREIDKETVYLDSAGTDGYLPARRFRLSLDASDAVRPVAPIDQVDVQVCRDLGPLLPAITCGDVQTYRRPRVAPAT